MLQERELQDSLDCETWLRLCSFLLDCLHHFLSLQVAGFWVMIYSCCTHGSLPSHSQSLPASSCLARHERKVNRQMGSQIKLQNQSEDLSLQMNSSQRQSWGRTQLMRWQMKDVEYSFHSWKGRVSQSCGLSWRSTPSVQHRPPLQHQTGFTLPVSRLQEDRCSLVCKTTQAAAQPKVWCTTTQGGVCV